MRIEDEIEVSIPFKREGLSELYPKKENYIEVFMFQFPSNGKDFLNSKRGDCHREDVA